MPAPTRSNRPEVGSGVPLAAPYDFQLEALFRVDDALPPAKVTDAVVAAIVFVRFAAPDTTAYLVEPAVGVAESYTTKKPV